MSWRGNLKLMQTCSRTFLLLNCQSACEVTCYITGRQRCGESVEGHSFLESWLVSGFAIVAMAGVLETALERWRVLFL